jgi:parallel beta-helix repeat protein
LLVEGSYAIIQANIFDKNIKANIALGGKGSGQTKIRWNLIEGSKAEGVFVVEGEDRLLIEDNRIRGNLDGVVMVNSKGVVRKNDICENQRSGFLSAA